MMLINMFVINLMKVSLLHHKLNMFFMFSFSWNYICNNVVNKSQLYAIQLQEDLKTTSLVSLETAAFLYYIFAAKCAVITFLSTSRT